MSDETTSPRPPLTKTRVLRAALDLADREGLGALTMRRLGAELGVEAMSLYKHVANKKAIMDGIVEVVVGEIGIPTDGADWKQAMRRRAISARQVLSRHSWAIGLLEARGSTGPNALHYVDAILGNLRTAGFSITLAAHAFWLLDSYVYGHVIQETSLRFTTSEEMTKSTQSLGERTTPKEYPHLVEMGEHALRSAYSVDNEFEFGLDLILDGLENLHERSPVVPKARTWQEPP
jgi:AcrR family transcriptional regulator